MSDRTPYQKRLIRNYYQNRDAVALQRAQELVSELYLSSGKKRARHWESLRKHLPLLGISSETIENVIARDDPRLVAELLQKLA